MKKLKILFAVIAFVTMFHAQNLSAVPENNPPCENGHTWGDEQYDVTPCSAICYGGTCYIGESYPITPCPSSGLHQFFHVCTVCNARENTRSEPHAISFSPVSQTVTSSQTVSFSYSCDHGCSGSCSAEVTFVCPGHVYGDWSTSGYPDCDFTSENIIVETNAHSWLHEAYTVDTTIPVLDYDHWSDQWYYSPDSISPCYYIARSTCTICGHVHRIRILPSLSVSYELYDNNNQLIGPATSSNQISFTTSGQYIIRVILECLTCGHSVTKDINITVETDTDRDEIADTVEVANNMDPNTAATDGGGYKVEKRILENAQDGLASRWMEITSTGASVDNTSDPIVLTNKIIKFSGNDLSSGFKLDISPVESIYRKISWRMRYDEDYNICVKLNTNEGARYIIYSPSTQNVTSDTVYIAFGTGTKDGKWQTFIRNLITDLVSGFPNATISSVDQVQVYGSGIIDDLKLIGYVDSDNDMIPDSIETTYNLAPNSDSDASADADNDGLTNLQEFIHGTKLNLADSDGDGLTDLEEIGTYETNPVNPDSDSDSINDKLEIDHGMNPNLPATQAENYLYEQRMLEDAEDGLASRWTEYTSTSATVSNITDPSNEENKIIQFQGTGTSSGFELTLSPAESAMRKISWEMNFNETYFIYVVLDTSEGTRYIAYNPSVHDVTSDTVYIALGTDTYSGVWQIYMRNLISDFASGFPNATINSITHIRVSGSGMIDDLRMLAYVDSDNDGIPDSAEDALGLDKNDASDAAADPDNDGLTNLDEFINGTPMNNSDADGDGLNDRIEVKTYGSNPFSNDSDSDGLSDYWELHNIGNQDQTLYGDHDNDGFSNLEESQLELGFNKIQEIDNSIDLIIYEYKK